MEVILGGLLIRQLHVFVLHQPVNRFLGGMSFCILFGNEISLPKCSELSLITTLHVDLG